MTQFLVLSSSFHLTCKEIQPVHSKGDQSWVFIGRTDAKAETPILWPPHAKSWIIGKDSDAGRDWGQEEKGTTEDEMAGWHYRLDGHKFEWTLGVGDEQGGLAGCDSWGRKKSDTTERLNWTDSLHSGEGNGTPLQYSCLENPVNGGAWWAAVHGITKSRDTTERLHLHFSLSCIGEGNGNPLQCSCLENPKDRGAWWAAVYGVAQSRTWLMRLSSSSSNIVFIHFYTFSQFSQLTPKSTFIILNI